MGLEITSDVERRRRCTAADRLRIVAEADEADAKVAEVARRMALETQFAGMARHLNCSNDGLGLAKRRVRNGRA
jgi:transposase-like protein